MSYDAWGDGPDIPTGPCRCAECGWEGDWEETDEEDGVRVCPECRLDELYDLHYDTDEYSDA